MTNISEWMKTWTGGDCSDGEEGGGVLVVRPALTDGAYVFDKTWKEVHDAITDGTFAVCIMGSEIRYIDSVTSGVDMPYRVNLFMPESNSGVYRYSATCAAEDGYPAWED